MSEQLAILPVHQPGFSPTRCNPPLLARQDGGSTGGGVVTLSDGASVPYDWLVVSLGAETSTFGLPGVKECALPFSTYEDAQRVRTRGLVNGAGQERFALAASLLDSLLLLPYQLCTSGCGCAAQQRDPAEPPPHRCRRPQVAARLQLLEELVGYPEVVVVGGGYAGVELAAVVAERLRGRARIKLVTSTADILPGSPQVGGWHGQACLLPPFLPLLPSSFLTSGQQLGQLLLCGLLCAPVCFCMFCT